MSKIILGIDPGLQKTGWAIITPTSYSRYKIIDSGVIKTVKNEVRIKNSMHSSIKNDTQIHNNFDNAQSEFICLSNRILFIYNELNKIIDLYNPNFGSIENTYINSNFDSSLKLSHARAAAIIACKIHNIDLFSYPAKTVKKILTGSGNADKFQVQSVLRYYIEDCNIKNNNIDGNMKSNNIKNNDIISNKNTISSKKLQRIGKKNEKKILNDETDAVAIAICHHLTFVF